MCAPDLDELSEQLSEPPKGGIRRTLKYVTAPLGSGKTCSILPAFLNFVGKPGGFTHYLYLPFHNSDHRNFNLSPKTPSIDAEVAYDQGAAFIVECMYTLLHQPNRPGPYRIPRWDKPMCYSESVWVLHEMLGACLVQHANC